VGLLKNSGICLDSSVQLDGLVRRWISFSIYIKPRNVNVKTLCDQGDPQIQPDFCKKQACMYYRAFEVAPGPLNSLVIADVGCSNAHSKTDDVRNPKVIDNSA